jgi:hypothetical protein
MGWVPSTGRRSRRGVPGVLPYANLSWLHRGRSRPGRPGPGARRLRRRTPHLAASASAIGGVRHSSPQPDSQPSLWVRAGSSSGGAKMFSVFEKILEPELDGSARTRNRPTAGWGEATHLPRTCVERWPTCGCWFWVVRGSLVTPCSQRQSGQAGMPPPSAAACLDRRPPGFVLSTATASTDATSRSSRPMALGMPWWIPQGSSRATSSWLVITSGPSPLITWLKRASSYRYAAKGELPVKRLGGRIFIITAKIRPLIDGTEGNAA